MFVIEKLLNLQIQGSWYKYSIKNRLSISFSEANNSGHEVEGGSKVLNL